MEFLFHVRGSIKDRVCEWLTCCKSKATLVAKLEEFSKFSSKWSHREKKFQLRKISIYIDICVTSGENLRFLHLRSRYWRTLLRLYLWSHHWRRLRGNLIVVASSKETSGFINLYVKIIKTVSLSSSIYTLTDCLDTQKTKQKAVQLHTLSSLLVNQIFRTEATKQTL